MAQPRTIDWAVAGILTVCAGGASWVVSHYINKIEKMNADHIAQINALERRIDILEAYRVGHEEYEKWQQKLLEHR